MESGENYMEFERENDRLREGKSRATALLIVFMIISFASIGYIGYSEVYEPFFGKWPKMARDFESLQVKADSLRPLKSTIDNLQAANDLLMENSDKQEGTFFEVQIGAFEHFNFQKYRSELAQLRAENVDEMDKYTLGKFRKYATAQSFKRDIEKMGIQGAFIVGKIDGQRVEISDAIRASKKKLYK